MRNLEYNGVKQKKKLGERNSKLGVYFRPFIILSILFIMQLKLFLQVQQRWYFTDELSPVCHMSGESHAKAISVFSNWVQQFHIDLFQYQSSRNQWAAIKGYFYFVNSNDT